MSGVLSRILDGQVEASVQTSQLLDRLSPEHLLILPRLGLPRLRQSFPDRAVELDPPLDLSTLVCPETQIFQCRWAITEES